MNRKREGKGNLRLIWIASLSLLMALTLAAVGYTQKTSGTASGVNQTLTQVDIDAVPGDAAASAKLPSARNVSVTVFSSSSFDATTLSPSSLSFRDAQTLEGPTGANNVSVRDVNKDNHPDLIVEFLLAAINKRPTKMILEGRTDGGTLIQGSACVQASGAPCGGTITVEANKPEEQVTAPAGPNGNNCSEFFDGVTPPALPVNWAAVTTVDCANSNPWETSAAGDPAPPADSLPNAAFVNDPNCISDERLESPPFLIVSTAATLTFRQNRNIENGFDGTVLEVSINGGAFQDILAAGGIFAVGGYNGTISVNFGSPIAGRQAWTGSSAGFVTTTVNLPMSANGQNWRFRWRRATDSSVSGQGFRLDSVSIGGSDCSVGGCTITCPANVTVDNDSNQCGAVVNYPPPTTEGCAAVCSPASGSFFPVGTTTVTCQEDLAPSAPSGLPTSCAFTVTVVDAQPPSITCPENVTQSNDPDQCGAVVNYPAPVITDNCPGALTATCVPASGSFFPVGTTTVTCTIDGFANGASPNGDQCPDFRSITHSTSQAIVALNSVACFDAGSGTTTAASYWRAFSLPSFSIIGVFDVTSVDIGIEEAISGLGGKGAKKSTSISRNSKNGKGKTGSPSGGGPGQQITVNLYTNSGGAFPGGMRSLIATQDFNIPDQVLTVVNLPIAALVPAGSELVVEVFSPDGFEAGNAFFIGSNDAGETGPSYLSAPDCGIPNPIPLADAGFPDMHIVMNVNGCAQPVPTCTFTVTVNDTQPPSITCPANVTAVTDQNCDGAASCQVATFPTPTASDNCPGVVVVCNPPSGSCFPVGVTTVTCTATDAVGNTATCSFTVTTFDTALQDDSDPTIVLLWNSITGQYRFCCQGITFTGVGQATIQGCVFTLQHNPADRRVLGRVDKAVHAGSASIQAPAGTIRCTITDRNTLNDTPMCQ